MCRRTGTDVSDASRLETRPELTKHARNCETRSEPGKHDLGVLIRDPVSSICGEHVRTGRLRSMRWLFSPNAILIRVLSFCQRGAACKY